MGSFDPNQTYLKEKEDQIGHSRTTDKWISMVLISHVVSPLHEILMVSNFNIKK